MHKKLCSSLHLQVAAHIISHFIIVYADADGGLFEIIAAASSRFRKWWWYTTNAITQATPAKRANINSDVVQRTQRSSFASGGEFPRLVVAAFSGVASVGAISRYRIDLAHSHPQHPTRRTVPSSSVNIPLCFTSAVSSPAALPALPALDALLPGASWDSRRFRPGAWPCLVRCN